MSIISNIKFIPPVSDLIIDFESGLNLELFSDSNIYESWALSDGKRFELISATAGQCYSFMDSSIDNIDMKYRSHKKM